jgi:uncharacterized cupredoxin-like copper-binding protein
MKFENTTHDFGKILEAEGSVEYTFEFTNNGNAPLVINDVKSTCGCTTPDWTDKPVLPGQKGSITAVFEPANRPGKFNKSMTIISNASIPQTRIYIKGEVDPGEMSTKEEYPKVMGGLRLKYSTFNFGMITTEKPVTREFKVLNDTNREITFEQVLRCPDYVSVKFLPQTLPSKSPGIIEVTLDPRQLELLGYNGGRVIIKTDEAFNSVKNFLLAVMVDEYFPPLTAEEYAKAPKLKIDEMIYDFGNIKQGEKVIKEFTISNTGKSDLNIRMTRATCGCTASEPEKSDLSPGESSKIKVTFDSTGRSGEQKKTVLVYSNDPLNPTQKITIKASIQSES